MADDNKVQRWELSSDIDGYPEMVEDDNGDYVEYDDYARLRAIVDRLPKTADGVVINPGSSILTPSCDGVPIEIFDVYLGQAELMGRSLSTSIHNVYRRFRDCYSTREAAERAAKEASDG